MRKHRWTLCLGLAALVLAGCGGDDEGTSPKKDGGKGEMKKLQAQPKDQEKANLDTGTPGLSPEDVQRRALVKLLKQKMAQTTDAFDRADYLGRAKELGAAAKPLWPQVKEALKDEESLLRAAALEAAAAIDPLSCRPLLEVGLKDDEGEVRQKAVEAWTTAKITDLSPLLKLAPDELESGVQMAAMLAVEKLGEPHHAVQVAGIFGDLDANALKPAVRFLVKLKADAHAEKLVPLLDRNDVDLRVLAAQSLAKLGKKNKTILNALATILVDDEVNVRRAGLEALKSLTGQDLSYDPEGDEEDLRLEMEDWKDWIKNNG